MKSEIVRTANRSVDVLYLLFEDPCIYMEKYPPRQARFFDYLGLPDDMTPEANCNPSKRSIRRHPDRRQQDKRYDAITTDSATLCRSSLDRRAHSSPYYSSTNH